MESQLMKMQGLHCFVAGAAYDFRQQTKGDQVKEDVTRALNEMKIEPRQIYSGKQVHGCKVGYADGESGDAHLFGKIYADTDGLITDKPGIALLVKYADCTPIVLYDPKRKVVAALHSGWRGTVQRISQKAIAQMVNTFGCHKEDIFAYLGPSIDRENYEVGPEVYEAFVGFAGRDTIFTPRGTKYHMSMSDANEALLREAGIQPAHIEVDRTSTFDEACLHSARAEGKEYGLNGLIVMIDF